MTGQISDPSHQNFVHMFIVYEGPSELNGEPIKAIITTLSTNKKTGPMDQLWILPKDSPLEAIKNGKDAAVCGDCKFRGGACYVDLSRAPNNIHKTHEKGHKYKALPKNYRPALGLRFGAYGDLAALPEWVISDLLKLSENGHTSYTHQWKKYDFQAHSMASVDNSEERKEAKAKGYRTFRVMKHSEKPEAGEILCPHYTRGVMCFQCGLCNGNKTKAKDIAVYVHGSKHRIKKFEEL